MIIDSLLDLLKSSDEEVGTPTMMSRDLIEVFHKMGVDPPKHLIKNELARRNAQKSAPFCGVQENLEAGFIQAYKLIAKGIDHAAAAADADALSHNNNSLCNRHCDEHYKNNLRHSRTVRESTFYAQIFI